MEQAVLQTKTFETNDITRLLLSVDRDTQYELESLVYYPYYLFEYKIKAKGLMRLKGHIGCTIDAISGRGAMIDQKPSLYEGEIHEKNALQPKLAMEAAIKKADEYLFHTASLKLKFLTMPKVELVKREKFYRPYWIVTPANKNGRATKLIVDAVSGTYHPI